MNKHLAHLWLTTIIILIISCKQKAEENSFDFEVNGKPILSLKGQKFSFEQLVNPSQISSINEFLIVVENSRVPEDYPVMHIVDRNAMEYLRPKGKKGIGPNEITDAHLVDPGFSDSTFWVNSSMSKRMAEFSLYDTSLLSVHEFKQPEKMLTTFKIYKATDSTYLGRATTDDNIFNEYDLNGNRINGYGAWPSIPNQEKVLGSFDKPTQNFLLGNLNDGRFRKDPFSKLFVLAMAYRNRIEFLDYESKAVWYIENPNTEIPTYRIGGSGANVVAAYSWDAEYTYMDVAFGNKGMYALFSGVSQNYYREASKLAETIFVLTKKGKVMAKLQLDASIRSIAVDENLGKIYGITTDEDPGIAVFDMPQELLDLLAE
ncbi:BF3164 family lipoprotein [Roseivirga pacifica]|uniref:BF3164 family lipoprotein n=1 Tax=Roseivirga pacifica TaxID=1267423 RepID=UPI003BAEE0C5